MKSNMFAKIAILLWVVTIAVIAFFFIRGTTTKGDDGRTAVVLEPAERNLVLTEMRGLLAATQGIVEGATKGDLQAIAKAARSGGMAAAADVNPALMAKLPLEFKQFGLGLHRDMDDIAKAAESGTPVPELLKMTSAVLGKCVTCHAGWQI